MTAPAGTGLWIAYPNAVEGGDRGKQAARLAQYRPGWIALRSGGNVRSLSPAGLAAWLGLAEAAGAQLFTWHYSTPADLADQAAQVKGLAAEGVNGHIVDAEHEWENPAAAAVVPTLAQALRGATPPGFYLGVTSFALPSAHPAFPWGSFLTWADGMHPQVYWTEAGIAADKFCNLLDTDWRRLLSSAPAHSLAPAPIGVTYGKGSSWGPAAPLALTAPDLAGFLDRYCHRRACSLYSWEAAEPTAWQAIASHAARLLASARAAGLKA